VPPVGVLPNSLLIVTDCSYALADAMAKLLGEEDDWSATASWLRDRALDDGFDLQMRYDSPKNWASDLVENLRFHVDFEKHWADGVPERFDNAEELFWRMLPHFSRPD
jgi:hypothetical protein